MLSYADIYDLNRIANNYACECNGHSKNELIQSILIAIHQKDVFEQQMNALEIEDIRLLNFLVFNQRGAFSLEDLLARVRQTKFDLKEDEKWNPRDIISKFKQRGWLFNGHAQQTKYLFHLPTDIKSKIMDALGVKFKAKIRYTADYPNLYRDEQSLMLDDILLFLKFMGQNEIQLSTEGYLYKRTLQQVMDTFSVQEEAITKSAWRFGYGRRFKEYPSRFSFIYDYCFFHDLIIEKRDTLSLTEKGREKASQGYKEDMLQIYRFWIKLYKGAIPNLQSLVQWIDRLSASWVSVTSLFEALGPLIKPYYYDSPESIFKQRMILMMLHLGLVRIGEDPAAGNVLQVSKLGSSLIQGIYVAEEESIDLKVNLPIQTLH
jgi:lambda repressor-like predicted transcriptional regulator